MDSKKKNSQTRKNRRRSTRNITLNGDGDDSKDDRNNKRSRDSKDNDEINQDLDLYKDILDLVPADHLDCSPTENPVLPGTRVNLHGVILHENETGLIVLNVRWRNKVYSGALLDIEKNKWACQRVKDHNNKSQLQEASPPIKKIKIPTSTPNISIEDNNKSPFKKKVTSPTVQKQYRNNNLKNLPSQDAQSFPPSSTTATTPTTIDQEEGTHLSKKTKKVIQSTDFDCPEPKCDRKYKNKTALANHVKNVHEKTLKSDLEDQSSKEKSEDSDSGEDQFVIDEKTDTTDENETMVDNNESLTENEKQIERLKLQLKESEKTMQSLKKEPPAEKLGNEEANSNIADEMNVSSVKDIANYCVKSEIEEIKEETKMETEGNVETSSNNVSSIIPSIVVDTVVNDTDAKPKLEPKQEDEHPKGSSHTIIHEDNIASLNELFAPAQTFQQYSPTLSNLNPQKINESLTDALHSKQQKEANTFSNDCTSTLPIENETVVKSILMAKPSLEVSPLPVEKLTIENMQFVKTWEFLGSSQTGEQIDCSDEERSSTPENVLLDCHKTYPYDEQTVGKVKPNVISITLGSGNLHGSPVVPGFLSHSYKGFENSLLAKELSSKLSSTAVNINSFATKLPTTRSLYQGYQGSFTHSMMNDIDNKKASPQLINFMKPASSFFSSPDTKPMLISSSIGDKTNNAIDVKSDKQSLLQQRLLGHSAEKSESDVALPTTIVNGLPLQPDISSYVQISTRQTETTNEIKYSNLQRVPFNMSKEPVHSLRGEIKPNSGTQERKGTSSRTWIPKQQKESSQLQQEQGMLSKDYFGSNHPISTSFPLPVTKSPMSSNRFNSPQINEKVPKGQFVLKRTSHPIPIAPAPVTTTNNISTSIVTALKTEFISSLEHTTADIDMEQPQMNRFTLTSDNRLIPSPAENRGRPRKIRVGKTQPVPVGTAQEIARSRGPIESTAMRKHPPSPVARASVIQGSLHGSNDVVINKSNEKGATDELRSHYQPSRNFDNDSSGDRERFALLSKMRGDVNRNNPDQYKEYPTISSPNIYRPLRQSSHPSGMLSPPNTASNESPSTRMSPETMATKTHYHHQMMKRMKSDNRPYLDMHHMRTESTSRPPETIRLGDNPQMPAFTPRDKMLQSPLILRPGDVPKDHRIPEFHNSSARFSAPGIRPDFLPSRSESYRNVYDSTRLSLEDKDSLRLRTDRFHPQTPPTIHHNISTTVHSTQSPSHLSTNLVLGRADGAIIGPLSYDHRNNDQRKR